MVRIFPTASGCRAVASTALPVAIPIPIPAPSPVSAAIPAPSNAPSVAKKFAIIVTRSSILITSVKLLSLCIFGRTHLPCSQLAFTEPFSARSRQFILPFAASPLRPAFAFAFSVLAVSAALRSLPVQTSASAMQIHTIE